MFDIDQCTIFLTLAGSQAHGTAGAGSDVDLRGVCIVPLQERLSLFGSFEQYEGDLTDDLTERVLPRLRTHETAAAGLRVKMECVVFDIRKFLLLCASANPNTLEILFADPDDWAFQTPAWHRLYDARHLFLTRQVQHTFTGYAMAQLKKIRSHRAWLLNPPRAKPSREDFGLSASGAALSRDERDRLEQAIAEKLRAYSVDDIEMPRAARIAVQERLAALCSDVLATSEEEVEARRRAVATLALDLPADTVAALNAEKSYRAAMREWESYQTWKTQRNPARAALEGRYGYDTKHAMHLIRLMRMGLEILERGELRVRRPDADELRAIRDGAWSFEDLLAAANELKAAIARAAEATTLPADVDHDRVDELAFALITHPL